MRIGHWLAGLSTHLVRSSVKKGGRSSASRKRGLTQCLPVAVETLESRQLLSATPAGSEFLVNTYTTSTQLNSAIAMDADGDYVIAWQSYGQDGTDSNFGVYAQRYNAAGTAQGSEFLVNTTTSNTQSAPAIAMDADGDFVITWQSSYQDGDGRGVYAQRYNAAGTAQGSEFLVNTITVNEQSNPSIAMDTSGDFVIAWEGGFLDFGTFTYLYDIKAQRYTVDGAPPANTAPTAVKLDILVTSLPENTDTAKARFLMGISIVDDGLGTNDLSLGGADAASFELGKGGLYLKSGVVLDYETKTSYDVTIIVDDTTVGNTPDVTATFTLSVTDVNENPNLAPTAVALVKPVTSFLENTDTSKPLLIGPISITDDGLGTNQLSLDGADSASFQIFDGNLYLQKGVVLDYETKTSYDVTIIVDDTAVGNTPDATVTFTLSVTDVNENPNLAPTAVELTGTTVALAESASTASRTKVADIVITDDGQGTNDLSLSGADMASFEVDAGVLYLKAGVSLDYETKTSYTVTVEVDDTTVGSTPDATAHFTLNINNVGPGAPADSSATPNQVPEGSAVGTATGIVYQSTLNGVTGPVVYELTDDAGGRFAIDSGTGAVTVANPALLDYETQSSYTVTVRATAGGEVSGTRTTLINVANVAPTAPADSDTSTPNEVIEGAAKGTSVGITASSSDINGTPIQYSLQSTYGGRFAIDKDTGVVTVGNGALLNFEAVASYTITVKAFDGKGGASLTPMTINIRNAAPATPFDSNAALNQVMEGSANGAKVGLTAKAIDPNGGPLAYSLTDNAGGRFSIDSTTGVVSVANGALLNYESATSHQITVQAQDPGGLSSTANFTINLTNRKPTPLTDSNAAVNAVTSASAVGTSVGLTVQSTDPSSPGSDLTYSLTNNAGGRFAIDAVTGEVTVANSGLITVTKITTYTITAQVSDGQGGLASKNFTIKVNPTPAPAPLPSPSVSELDATFSSGTWLGL